MAPSTWVGWALRYGSYPDQPCTGITSIGNLIQRSKIISSSVSNPRTVVRLSESISVCCLVALNYSSSSATFLSNSLCHFPPTYSQQLWWKYNTITPAYKRHSIYYMPWLKRHFLCSQVKIRCSFFNGRFVFWGRVQQLDTQRGKASSAILSTKPKSFVPFR